MSNIQFKIDRKFFIIIIMYKLFRLFLLANYFTNFFINVL